MTCLVRDLIGRRAPARAAAASCLTHRFTYHFSRWLGAGALALGGALSGHAEPAPSAGLPAVTVTATRMSTRVDDTVADTTVLDRRTLTQESGRSLTNLLSMQAGIQASRNGGAGQYGSVFIRGLEARHTLLLVDGMRLGSATVGVPSLSTLSPEAIQRIEIVRGPLSALYGSEAAGGVIQIFTRQGRQGLWPSAMVGLGSYGERQTHGALSFGQGAFDGAVFLGRSIQRGFSATNEHALWGVYDPDRDAWGQTQGSVRLGVQIAPDWRIEGSALALNGLSHYDDGQGADSRARVRNGVQTLRVRGTLTRDWSTQISLGRSTDVYDTLASASPYAELGATRTTQRQISWEHTVALPWGSALALLERLDQSVARPDPAYDLSNRHIDAAGFSLNAEQGRHAMQAGLRHDHNSQFGGQTTGTLAYGLTMSPQWRLGLQRGTSFVAPSFNQLYYPGFGNPTLQPEEGQHSEASLRWSAAGHTLRAAWIDHRIQGYISSGAQPVNVPHTRIDGAVFSYEGRWRGLILGSSYEHLDPRNVTAGPDAGKRLPRRADQALRARIDVPLGRLRVGGSVAAWSHRYDDAANTRLLPGFATLDARSEWALTPEWTLGLQGLNLLDKPYETAWGYNQTGRYALLSLRWQARECAGAC